MKNVIFLGPPGSGKGTHATKMSRVFSIPHISTGDMLREQIKKGTKLGLEAQRYMDAGELVPDEVILGMVEQRLQEPDCAEGCIFDGFPRTEAQAEALSRIVSIYKVLNLAMPDEAIVERMKGRRVCPDCGHTSHTSWGNAEICERCGAKMVIRSDDMPDTVLARLRAYHKKTKPLIDYYQQQNILEIVDADAEVGVVEERVRGALT